MASHRTEPDAKTSRISHYPDLVAGAFALVCLVGLVSFGAPLGASVIAPLVVYAGVCLLGIGDVVSGLRVPTGHWKTPESPLKACHRLARNLRSRVGEADDREVAARLKRILHRIDHSLIVIQEDQREDAACYLLPLIEATDQILAAYMRLVRRELASDESRAAFLENLQTLEEGCEDAWLRLNREAIVTLGTLSAMIDLNGVPSHPPFTAGTASRRTWTTALSSVITHRGSQS